MDNNIERLEKHIEVLKKSYDNIVIVMSEDVEIKKDEKTGVETVALKDDKIKTYADGIKRSAETLNYLFSEITEKEKELKDLKGDEVVDNKPKTDALNDRLE